MLTEEREEFILNELKKNRTVKLHHLMQVMNVSESTIRRDLSQLEEKGLLTRIHGGAKLNYHLDREASFNEKTVINHSEKMIIGQKAAQLVNEGEIIYLDAGTTTSKMIAYLDNKPSLVITNGLSQAEELSNLGYKVTLLGGQLRNSTKAIVGNSAKNQMEQYVFDKAFIGINGIHPDFGLTTADEEEAAIKSLAIRHSGRAFIVTDASKFDKVSFCKVGNLDEVSIITDTMTESHSIIYGQLTTLMEAKS